MSYEAIRWALVQPVDKSSAKFVLVAMANCVNGDGPEMQCWPSVTHVAEATGQDRKTVMDGMKRLRASGFIVDTGERRGATGQVPVYLLKTPENGTVTPSTPAPLVAPIAPIPADTNSTKNGTDTKNGTVPKTDANSTEFTSEQSRISLSTVPKAGHGTSKEPRRNQEGKKTRAAGFNAAEVDLPEWIERDDWSMWCRHRAGQNKPITEDGARLQLKKLDSYRDQGFTASEVIEHSVGNSYQGLYPPKAQGPPGGAYAQRGSPHAAASRTLFGSSQPESEVIDVEAR